ncbi:metallopeptidase TldD-related protein [Nakamurella lactea]|uniref:metallopeptidase TldD-related protein n=1 Tax=Nakamurella lactea TaxID=459515 RepID=UPI000422FD2F|nr:metallopeptidase TldD-related protein [Nakamurella lactea]
MATESGPASAAMLTPQQIVETALAASRSDGCIVVVNATGAANVRWANNTVTTSGLATSLSWFVVAVHGRAAGTVEASAVDATSVEAIAAVVLAAEASAESAAASGPARDAQPLVEGGADDGFADGPQEQAFEIFAPLLSGLSASFEAARSGERLLYGFARHELTTTYLGSSTGLRRRWVQPTGTAEVNAKSSDLQRSSWVGAGTADFTDVDVQQMTDGLSQRLEWARRSIELPPGRYDTVLPPTSVADFMIYLGWSAGARQAREGRSVFSAADGATKIGEKITDRPLSLYSDPAEPGIESSPFLATGSSSEESSVFDNGIDLGRTELIADGTVNALLQTRASAAEYGEAFTPGAENLVLRGGDETRSLDQLVGDLQRGLLVTSQWYIREVDPMTLLLTGLTRDGVYLVENGEVAGVVNNFRFNMSPLDVLRRASDIGATERCLSREWSDWFTRSAMPPIRVDGFNMSSVSKAQ